MVLSRRTAAAAGVDVVAVAVVAVFAADLDPAVVLAHAD